MCCCQGCAHKKKQASAFSLKDHLGRPFLPVTSATKVKLHTYAQQLENQSCQADIQVFRQSINERGYLDTETTGEVAHVIERKLAFTFHGQADQGSSPDLLSEITLIQIVLIHDDPKYCDCFWQSFQQSLQTVHSGLQRCR